MGKKRTSTDSDNEKGRIKLNNSKNQFKILLETANLTSKNQLLTSGLNTNKLQHILNEKTTVQEHSKHMKSKHKSHSKSEQISQAETDNSGSTKFKSNDKQHTDHLPKRKISKINKRTHEKVSSSSESSEEGEIQKPVTIKKEKLASTEEFVLSDDDKKVTMTIRKKDVFKNSDNSDLEVEKNDFRMECLPMTSQHVKAENVSSSEDEDNSNTDGIKTSQIGRVSKANRKSNKSHKHLHSTKKNPTTRFSSSDEDIKEKGNLRKQQMKQINSNIEKITQMATDSATDSSEDEETSQQETVHKNKVTERIRKGVEWDSHTQKLSDTSQNKVNVLQNICLTPPKLISPKEKLKEIYPGIKQLKNNMKLEFANTEDIYLFRIPKNVHPSNLVNITVSLEEKCKINIGEKYNIEPTPNIPQPTLTISDDCKILNFKGNIRMEKYIKSKKEPNIVIPEKKSVPLPENLKKRHPLFGSDYRPKIKLSEEVERKLDTAIANLLKKDEKLKKKRHKKIKHDNEDNHKEAIFTLLNNHSNKKRKKETSDDSAFCSSSSTEPTNKLNKNYRDNIINETLNRVKSEILTENESDHREYTSPKKKKKKNKMVDNSGEEIPQKKRSKKHIDDDEDHDITQLSSPNYENRLVVNSTLISGTSKMPSFNPEVSRIAFDDSSLEKRPKKSKKKNKHDVEMSWPENQLISDIMDTLKNDLNPSKKVKKKKTKELK